MLLDLFTPHSRLSPHGAFSKFVEASFEELSHRRLQRIDPCVDQKNLATALPAKNFVQEPSPHCLTLQLNHDYEALEQPQHEKVFHKR